MCVGAALGRAEGGGTVGNGVGDMLVVGAVVAAFDMSSVADEERRRPSFHGCHDNASHGSD